MLTRKSDPSEEYLLYRDPGALRGVAHRPSASALKYGDAPSFTRLDSGVAKKEGNPCFSWKGLTILLILMSAAMVVALCVLLVYHFYYRRCDIWLSDVSINELTSDPSGDTATGVLAFTIEARNPTKSQASITHASFRLEFFNELMMAGDSPSNHITFPNSPDTWSPKNDSGHIPIYHSNEGTVQIISSNFPFDAKDNKLVHSGCFGIRVTGDITYSVSTVSYTTDINREYVKEKKKKLLVDSKLKKQHT